MHQVTGNSRSSSWRASFAGGAACADGSGDPAVASSDNGKYADKDGNPTYKISPDGTVDWYTFSGFRRYHSDCHVCHGPNGEGSSYAPALANSLKTLSYSRLRQRRHQRPQERRRRQRQGDAVVRDAT